VGPRKNVFIYVKNGKTKNIVYPNALFEYKFINVSSLKLFGDELGVERKRRVATHVGYS